MKYIKKFENQNFDDYKDKIFIVFLKSELQIIFVDNIDIDHDEYRINGNNVITFKQDNGKYSLNYATTCDRLYSKDEFYNINFMTVKEFYNKYESLYIRILEEGLFTRLFSNNYVKKIVEGFDKISNDKLGKPGWVYIDKNDASFFIKTTERLTISNIILNVEFVNQWLQVKVRKNTKIEELEYIQSLLIEYGQKMKDGKLHFLNAFAFYEYILTLENADKFIKKLTVEDFELFKTINKFNI
jgi:hypothetical protein